MLTTSRAVSGSLPHCNTHAGVGKHVSVRVSDELQENVKTVKDGSKSRIMTVLRHDLHKETRISV